MKASLETEEDVLLTGFGMLPLDITTAFGIIVD